MTSNTPGPAPQDPTATPAAAPPDDAPKKRGPGRPGGIGEKIFEQVETLGEQGLSRTEAFQRISAESGRRSGTVAANYYRIARKKRGDEPSSDRPARRGRPRGRRKSSPSGGSASAALATAKEALEQLSEVVSAQEKELAELRERSADLDKVRALIEK